MGFNLDFVYYRNFTFDGKFHVRCTGDDLHKVKSIQYLLEREVPEGVVQLDGVNVLSQVHSGTVANHGCPATLSCEVLAGTYRITPLVTLIDSEVIKQDLDADADATLREGPLLIEVSEGELTRRILDTVPLSSSGTRPRRAAQEGATLPPLPEGQRYPALILVFSEGGHARFMADVQADASSSLAHDWPGLQKIIDLQPFLEPHEREDEHLQVLANHYWVEQPQGMPNATFSALVQSLNGLEYVEDSALLPPQLEPGNLLAFAAAAVIATLLTGGAYAAGGHGHDHGHGHAKADAHGHGHGHGHGEFHPHGPRLAINGVLLAERPDAPEDFGDVQVTLNLDAGGGHHLGGGGRHDAVDHAARKGALRVEPAQQLSVLRCSVICLDRGFDQGLQLVAIALQVVA